MGIKGFENNDLEIHLFLGIRDFEEHCLWEEELLEPNTLRIIGFRKKTF